MSKAGKVANAALRPLGLRIIRHRVVPTKVVRETEFPDDLQVYPETALPQTPRYLNIGADAFFHPYWHNLDNPSEHYAATQRDGIHVSHDLTSERPLPVKSDSLRIAYTSQAATSSARIAMIAKEPAGLSPE